jgi:hypothetical protein
MKIHEIFAVEPVMFDPLHRRYLSSDLWNDAVADFCNGSLASY